MQRASLVLLLLLAVPALARAQSTCTLTGRPYRLPIFVAEVGDAIVVTGHRADVVIDAARTHATGRVRSPLSFEGTVDLAELFLWARAGRALADGTLRLDEGANVRLHADGSVVALLGAGLTATLPSLPCRDLTLTRPRAREIDDTRLPPLTHRIAGGATLSLYARVDADVPAATLTTTEAVDVTITATRNGRALVATDFGMSRVHGWVDAAQLTAIEPHAGTSFLMGDMIGGACGRSDHPYTYDGPAHVRAGATVRGPEGAEWARVTRSLSVARVGIRAFDAGQAELLRVEGLESRGCGQDLLFDLAVVSTDDVVVPRDAPP